MILSCDAINQTISAPLSEPEQQLKARTFIVLVVARHRPHHQTDEDSTASLIQRRFQLPRLRSVASALLFFELRSAVSHANIN